MQVTGNTILITGGGSGIGRGLAEAFHQLGNQVVISGRDQQKLDETTAASPGMKALTVDMNEAASIRTFAAQLTEQFPALNVVIHNAGIMRNENLLQLGDDTQAAEATIATNLLGPIRLTAALLPALQKQPHSTLMTVTSGLAYLPLALTPTYCATKAAIHSYTESLRYQLRDTNVEVLELVPPYVATSLMGERQANDPNAMPLDEFVAEVIDILKTQSQTKEICVGRVQRQRNAASSGPEQYNQFFQQFNDTMLAAREAEF